MSTESSSYLAMNMGKAHLQDYAAIAITNVESPVDDGTSCSLASLNRQPRLSVDHARPTLNLSQADTARPPEVQTEKGKRFQAAEYAILSTVVEASYHPLDIETSSHEKVKLPKA